MILSKYLVFFTSELFYKVQNYCYLPGSVAHISCIAWQLMRTEINVKRKLTGLSSSDHLEAEAAEKNVCFIRIHINFLAYSKNRTLGPWTL